MVEAVEAVVVVVEEGGDPIEDGVEVVVVEEVEEAVEETADPLQNEYA